MSFKQVLRLDNTYQTLTKTFASMPKEASAILATLFMGNNNEAKEKYSTSLSKIVTGRKKEKKKEKERLLKTRLNSKPLWRYVFHNTIFMFLEMLI